MYAIHSVFKLRYGIVIEYKNVQLPSN